MHKCYGSSALLQPKQLAAFRLVMTSGSMTSAAAQLGVSQPAVSRLISDLEIGVGFRLFERLNNKLIPTAEAQLFYEHVEHWHVGLESVQQAADGIRNRDLGHIALAAMSGLSVGLINHVIGNFLRPRPNVTFSLEVGSSESSLRLLNGAKVDLALVQWGPSDERIHLVKLPAFEAVCVMPEDHRLARQAFVRVEDLEGEQLISMHKHSPLRIRTDAALLHAGVTVHRRIESSVSASICELVHLGFGIAVTNPFSIHHIRPNNVIWRPFQPALPYEMAIALPRHRTRPKLLDQFIEHLTGELTQFAQRHTHAELCNVAQ